MKVGIVGHEAAKFTPETEHAARQIIRTLLATPDAIVVSGACHLGGIDVWAEEIADAMDAVSESLHQRHAHGQAVINHVIY